MPIQTRFDARDRWIRLFDPATHADSREGIEREFSEDIKTAVRQRHEGKIPFDGNMYSLNVPPGYNLVRLRSSLEAVEENTLVVCVMSGGYGPGRLVYTELEYMQKASGVALVGYSIRDTAKAFRDGTTMDGKIFAPAQHIEAMKSHDGTILLVENYIRTATTVVTLGSNLRRLGLEQPISRLDAGCYKGPFIIENWQNRWTDQAVCELPTAEMFDQHGKMYVPALTAALR